MYLIFVALLQNSSQPIVSIVTLHLTESMRWLFDDNPDQKRDCYIFYRSQYRYEDATCIIKSWSSFLCMIQAVSSSVWQFLFNISISVCFLDKLQGHPDTVSVLQLQISTFFTPFKLRLSVLLYSLYCIHQL